MALQQAELDPEKLVADILFIRGDRVVGVNPLATTENVNAFAYEGEDGAIYLVPFGQIEYVKLYEKQEGN